MNRAEFAAGFRRSRKGNLWRRYGGRTLTVFGGVDSFSWCIADGERRRFSRGSYDSERSALSALWCEVEGGGPC
jgi:hypothetical protein